MKWRLLFVSILLIVLTPAPTARADWDTHGLYVVGDDNFRAKVDSALDVIGYAGWMPYVRNRIDTIQQWWGDGEEAHIGKVIIQPDAKGLIVIRGDVGDVNWLSQALIHESAHVSFYRKHRNLDGSEEQADFVTEAYSEQIGIDWGIR